MISRQLILEEHVRSTRASVQRDPTPEAIRAYGFALLDLRAATGLPIRATAPQGEEPRNRPILGLRGAALAEPAVASAPTSCVRPDRQASKITTRAS